MIRIALQNLVVLFLAMSLFACDDKTGGGGPPPPGAKPGHLTGKLSDSQGQPLSNVTIRVYGFDTNGKVVKMEKKFAGPASEYDIDVPEGKYDTPVARITADYDGRWYDLPLAAADGTRDWTEQHDSKQGMVRDFVWKISGKTPGGDPNGPDGFWGGTIQFDLGGTVGDFASLEVTLKPDGALIDGSEGQPLVFLRKLPWKRQDHYLLDVPIGKYTATARVIFGSSAKPLRLTCYTIDPTNPETPTPTDLPPKVKVEFECQEIKTGEWKLLMPNLTAFQPL